MFRRSIALLLIGILISFDIYAADTTIKGTTADATATSLEVTNSANTALLTVRNDGNIGVATSSPNTTFDINGSFAHRRGEIAITAATNNNVNVGNFAFIKITSATANFTITGITGGVDGRRLVIWNSTTRNMTLVNNNAGSTAANRILTNAGNRSTSAQGTAEFVYDSGSSRWVLVNLDS